MRKDQKEFLAPGVKESIENVYVAVLACSGVKCLEDMLPNADKFISELVEHAFSSDFTEAEIDEMIEFQKKFANKKASMEKRMEEYTDSYMKKNQKVIEAMIESLEGGK